MEGVDRATDKKNPIYAAVYSDTGSTEEEKRRKISFSFDPKVN